jgi:hypothetical protein
MTHALKIVRTAFWIAAAAGLGASSLSAQNSTAKRWMPWEQELISNTDYVIGNGNNTGNPYRDLALKVQYWRRTGTTCGNPVTGGDGFVSYGFWEGGKRSGNGPWVVNNKRFLIRSTFPVGSWCWKTTCALALPDGTPSATPNCAGDSGLTKTGMVEVTAPVPETTNQLWLRGLPRASATKRSLVYGDGTHFSWLGDTAWDAPIKAYDNPTPWSDFLIDREKKGFRTVLVAPATQTVAAIPTVGFVKRAGSDCNNTAVNDIVPNRCTRWDGSYWDKFDKLILQANQTANGIVPIVAGVMDPTVRGGENNGVSKKFPASAEAKVFARNLAARLAGYFVVFSPSYDAKTTAATGANQSYDGLSVFDLVKMVGPAIQSAAPRHLIGAHLGGSNSLATYLLLNEESWLSVQLFQSGHGGTDAGTSCNFSGADEATVDFRRAVCRARVGALEFRCLKVSAGVLPACGTLAVPGTVKPAVNVEAEYESNWNKTTQARDNSLLAPSRIRARHTAWVTALSGSFGFNIGNYKDITSWTKPEVHKDSHTEGAITNLFKSDNDLLRMNAILAQSPWTTLEPWHKLESTFDSSLEETKRHVALAKPVLLEHVPAIVSSTSATTFSTVLSRVGPLAGVVCSGASTNVSVVWVDPRGDAPKADVVGKCEVVGTTLKVTTNGQILACPTGQSSCDWILKLTSNAIASGSAPLVAAVNATLGLGMKRYDLRVWTQIDEDSGGATVLAERVKIPSGTTGPAFKVNADEARMRSLPTVTKDSNGNFLVVWQQAGDDGTDDVYAVQVSQAGVVQSEPFRVNTSSENQNGEPSVTSDLDGSSIVTWTEAAPDGSLGNVWMRTYNAAAEPDTDPVLVAGGPGDQKGSKVQVDGAGNVLVAWSSDPEPEPIPTEPGEGDPLPAGDPVPEPGVYLAKLLLDGTPLVPAIALHETATGVDSVVDLKVDESGAFTLVWETAGDGEETDGYFERDYDADGAATTAVRAAGGS